MFGGHFMKGSKAILICLSFIIHLCCLISFSYGQATEAGHIVNLKGRVDIFHVSEKVWKKATPGAALKAGDEVRTGADGRAFILLVDETLLQLNANTHFILENVTPRAGWLKMPKVIRAALTKARSAYRLIAGELWLRNKNRLTDIDINALTFVVGVRGTELNLSVEPDETVVLTVLRGVVTGSNALGSLRVGAGEQAVVKPDQAPMKRLLITPEDAVQWTLHIPEIFDYRDFYLYSNDRKSLMEERDRLEALLQKELETVEHVRRLGKIYRDLGLTEKAQTNFKKALSLDPYNAEGLTGFGWTYIDQHRPADALDIFGSIEPPTPQACLGASIAQAQLGQLQKAMKTIEDCLALFPGTVPLRIQRAFLKLKSGYIKESYQELLAVTQQYPENHLGWSLTALTLLVLGEKQQALEAAERGVILAPHAPNAMIILAYAYQANFELKKAMDANRMALDLDEKNLTAMLNLARLQFGTDDIDEAWQTIEAAFRVNPESGAVHSLRGFLRLARLKTDEAITSFNEAVRLNPGQSEPYLGLGIALMRKGDVETAMEAITTAVLLNPRRSIYLSYWAKMLYQLRRFEQALDILTLAREMDPRDPTPELYRAIILYDLNRPSESIEALNSAINLNENRAVYRSRFLLDQDLAVKNVNLSILYNQLGLSAWATNKAMASIKQDYTNFAGHLFLGGALNETGTRTTPAGSELLLARILQPANINTLNRFNEYTSFFERPSLNGIIGGSVGNRRTKGGNVIAYGAHPAINTAFDIGAFYDSTDGWRETNSGRFKSIGGIFKMDPTPRDSISFSPRFLTLEENDAAYPRYEYDSPPDPYDRNDIKTWKLEFGYHHHFSPCSDFLLFLTWVEDDGLISNHELEEDVFGISGLTYENLWDADFKKPFYQAQLQQLYRIGDHQLIGGVLFYRRKNDVQSDIHEFFKFNGTTIQSSSSSSLKSVPQSLQSAYIQDIWQIGPQVIVEAAAYYERMKNSNQFSGLEWDLNEFNPRFGLIWTPSNSDTIRLAGFRYLLPFTTNRIDPMDIAGVPIFRNAQEGSVAKEADLVWEHEWSRGLLSTNLFYLARDFSQVDLTWHSRVKGAEIILNQLLFSGLGLSAGYAYADVEDENLPEADRNDHLVKAALTYLHHSGFSASLAQTFRYEDLKDSERNNENIWITDMAIGYELPGKRGQARLEIFNIFDQKFNWVTDFFTLQGRVPAREILFSFSLNF
jgi:tetratricopeptide (TPR) repeat protein